MKSIKNTILDYEDMIRDTLNVSNPALLKTGALGTLVNIFANIKYDNAIYYNKLLREMNPATATEFNSLLFHSSILNYNITFGIPSISHISILIPEFRIKDTELVTYNIPRSVNILDNNGLEYTIIDDIKVYVNNSVVTANSYSDNEIKSLEVSKVKNPLDDQSYMYMVEYDNMYQYKREFNKFNIPEYEIGEIYNFSVDIPSLDDIYEINAWIRKENHLQLSDININELLSTSSNYINRIDNLIDMKIKYNKFNASQFDNNLYLKIMENQLLFTVGDGINGLKLNQGDQIIIEVKLTKGIKGNVYSSESNIEDILVSSEDDGGYKTEEKTNLRVLSLNGGIGGSDIESVEGIRSDMIRKSSVRNGISSLNDYEVTYTIDGGVPFIDSKFFNSKNHLFIYNIIRDKHHNIIPTNTFNIQEDDFQTNLFMPTLIYNNIKLISPFYYKENYNSYSAYLINPVVKIELKTKSSVNKLLKLRNLIELYITYDYFEKKSRIVIKNVNQLFKYHISSNLFDLELNMHNEFEQVINQRFLDEYCIIEDVLKDIHVDIIENDISILEFESIGEYVQLIKKQDHFYFTELNRLDHTKETRHILQLPFISEDYTKKLQPNLLFNKLNNFFKSDEYNEMRSFNTGITQSFFNTISIDSKYREFILKDNVNGTILNTKNYIIINLILDKQLYALSDYETIEELEFDIKDTIYKTLLPFEGFHVEFYETSLEKSIINKYEMIKNVDVLTPKVFSTNSAREIYLQLEDKLNSTTSDISQYDMINFIPSYFYFDYSNINLNIKIQ